MVCRLGSNDNQAKILNFYDVVNNFSKNLFSL